MSEPLVAEADALVPSDEKGARAPGGVWLTGKNEGVPLWFHHNFRVAVPLSFVPQVSIWCRRSFQRGHSSANPNLTYYFSERKMVPLR